MGAALPFEDGAAETAGEATEDATVDAGAVVGALTAAPPPWKKELKSILAFGATFAAVVPFAAVVTGAETPMVSVAVVVEGMLPKFMALPGLT